MLSVLEQYHYLFNACTKLLHCISNCPHQCDNIILQFKWKNTIRAVWKWSNFQIFLKVCFCVARTFVMVRNFHDDFFCYFKECGLVTSQKSNTWVQLAKKKLMFIRSNSLSMDGYHLGIIRNTETTAMIWQLSIFTDVMLSSNMAVMRLNHEQRSSWTNRYTQ